VPRRRIVRGHHIAVLIGLDKKRATLWNIYSQSIKPDIIIKVESTQYNFYESVINQLRPSIKQGVKTIIIASPNEKNYEAFYSHIDKHQRWLIGGYELNQVTLEYVKGSANDLDAVLELIEESSLQRTIREASKEDVNRVMRVLEKRLSTPRGIDTLLFTLNEIEEALEDEESNPEYVLLTNEFQRSHRRRTQRLLQIAQNKRIKSLIVDAGSSMGRRLTQFGGLICMMRITSNF